MTLILPIKSELPVFDIPTENIYKTDFVDRRILTIVGRAVLSEKNQPIKPSTDYKYRKCYAASDSILYRLKRLPNEKASESLNFRVKINETIDFSAPFLVYYNYKRLRQKTVYYPINSKLSEEISPFKTNYKKYASILNQIFEPHASNNFYLTKLFPYPKDSYRFNFNLIKNEIIIDNILHRESQIINRKESLSLISHFVYNYELALTNDLSQVCLYDFSKFATKYLDKLKFLGIIDNLTPIEPSKEIIINKNSFETDYKLKTVLRYLEGFNYVWKKIFEEITTTEIFAKFYLTSETKLKPFIERLSISSDAVFSSEISNILSDSTINQNFNTRVLDTKKQLEYRPLPKKETNPLETSSIHEFKIDLKNEKFDAYSLKKQILAGEKPLIVPIKYKSPRLALKLKINKPKIASQNYTCKIQDAKPIKPILDFTKSKKLLAKYSRILFKHECQKEFANNLDKYSISIKSNYKQRRSNFFNKSPKHALYSYKKIHNILINNSFYKNKKLKFLFKAFILPQLVLRSKNYQNQKYIYDSLSTNKLSYSSKVESNIIKLKRNNINNIVFPEKQKISSQINTPIEKLNQTKRIGLNHLRKLKLLILNIFKNKLKYKITFLVPQKRILPIKIKQPLRHSLFNLTVLKKSDELYTHKARETDCFSIYNKKQEYDFCKYLPKQIVDQLQLVFNIIDFKPVETLVQKDIIPPPSWKKEIKNYICRLKLGPYPFGFPSFSQNPPHFYVLTTRDRYSIKDTNNDYIYRESSFILTKDRLYLPDLSMKKPKRMLHSEITAKNSPKEYYTSKAEQKCLQQNQPKAIGSFKHSWLYEQSETNRIKNNQAFFIYQRIRNRKYLFKRIKTDNKPYAIKDNYLTNNLKPAMPQVNRFLIKKSVYKLAKSEGTIIQNGYINYWSSKIPFKLKDKTIPSFVSKNLGCRITKQKDWTLPQYFPDTYPANETEIKYSARFRSFHFPYIPEISFVYEKAVSYSKISDDSILNSCKFQEDFRVSQFDFGLAEILNNEIDNYNSNNVNKTRFVENIYFESDKIITRINKEYIQPILPKPTLVKSEIPNYLRHLISPKFFKLIGNLNYKFKRRGQTLNSLKYIQNLDSAKENYYIKSDKLPDTFESISFHWIILLRKKNDIITNLKYISDEQTLYKEEFKAEYNFESLKNKIVVNDIYQNPVIKQIEREIFEKADDINNISLPVNFVSDTNFINKETKIEHILCLNSPITQNGLEDKSDYRYNLITKGKFTGEIKETDNSINSLKKSRLTFSAFIFDRPKESFKLNLSARPKRSPYRPVYIPDFMDINTNKKEIEIIDEFIE